MEQSLAGKTGAHELLPLIAFEALLTRFLVTSLHLLLLSGLTALGRFSGEALLHKRLPLIAFSIAQSIRLRLLAAIFHFILFC